MTLIEEYKSLIMKRDNLLREKEINKEKIDQLNELIDYYKWVYNSCLYEENYYNESITSYSKMLKKSKYNNLFDFSLFLNGLDKYFSLRIESLKKKIEENTKKKNSVHNLLVIKLRERENLKEKNYGIDFYITEINEEISNNKVLIKDNSDK